jgi:hypothetical protein
MIMVFGSPAAAIVAARRRPVPFRVPAGRPGIFQIA